MISILNEISKLRNGIPLIIDYKNSNRYRIVSMEPNNTKTAYYFSAPIYNSRTRKIVDMVFHKNGEALYYVGSNANITISNDIKMENESGACTILFGKENICSSESKVLYDSEQIFPTTNGIAIRSTCPNGKPFTFTFETNKPFLEIRANDKYFAMMSEKFRPFFTISCIGTEDNSQNIISPARLNYQKITDRKYTISISPCTSTGYSILLEANLYDHKLFQDTTVESNNPKSNNAFGGIGYIGSSQTYGEQWLYSRSDFTKLTELNDKKILQAILHIPKWNKSAVELSTSLVSARFCSFGSNWNNKISEKSMFTASQITDHYINIDLTSILADKYGQLTANEGFILKEKKKGSGFSVISTGDNYLKPQILEINYK